MTVYRDSAVVLRVTKLGEADRIVTLLTRRTGRVRAVAKGVRRTRSKFGGRLEPFSHVDLQLFQGRSLDIVTQAVALDSFGGVLAADYPRYTAATAIVEAAERMTAEEREPSLKLYLLLVGALRALSTTDREPSLVLDSFLLRAMVIAGWSPALRECARCGSPGPHSAFSVASGGLLCTSCRTAGAAGATRPAAPCVELMAALAAGDWAEVDRSTAVHRREASGLIAALLQWHLERGLRSLPMVDRTAATPLVRGRGGTGPSMGTAGPGSAGGAPDPALLDVSAAAPAIDLRLLDASRPAPGTGGPVDARSADVHPAGLPDPADPDRDAPDVRPHELSGRP